MNPTARSKGPGNSDWERFDNAVRKVFSPANVTIRPIEKAAIKRRAKKRD
jgi:hypothetical protein